MKDREKRNSLRCSVLRQMIKIMEGMIDRILIRKPHLTPNITLNMLFINALLVIQHAYLTLILPNRMNAVKPL